MLSRGSEKNFISKTFDKVCPLIEKYYGISPYKEQKDAASEMLRGNIVQQGTGEGKTISVLLAMLLMLERGRKVYIVTSNDYLAERDFNFSKPILSELGYKSAFLKEGIGGIPDQYKEVDAIYATGATLIFDYLRGLRPTYDIAIIDEIDFILVESANHDFSVSDENSIVKMPKEVFLSAKALSDRFTYKEKTPEVKKEELLFDFNYEAQYVIDQVNRSVYLTKSGFELIESVFGSIDNNLLFIDALISTLLVKHFYINGVNYIVRDGEIVIINDASGRISPNGHNDLMIQTAIEVKEGLPINDKPLLTNTCAYPVFFSVFKDITGISGTTSYVPYDFSEIYSKAVKVIPPHLPSGRKEIFEYFTNEDARSERIREIIQNTHSPVLLVGDSDKRALELKAICEDLTGKSIHVLSNESLDNEQQLLDGVKSVDAVLISSKIVGRGTDIVLPSEFEEGLTVILAQRLLSERAERQIIGRTGRNGRNGTAFVLTCDSDNIYKLKKGRIKHSEKQIKALQSIYESQQYESRKHIYLRSRLFFDQDKALSEIIDTVLTFEEIYKLVTSYAENQYVSIVKRAVDLNLVISDYYRSRIMSAYKKIRPYYQQQFYYLCDRMAGEMKDNNGFYDLSKVYEGMSRNILAKVTAAAIYDRVMAEEKNRKTTIEE